MAPSMSGACALTGRVLLFFRFFDLTVAAVLLGANVPDNESPTVTSGIYGIANESLIEGSYIDPLEVDYIPRRIVQKARNPQWHVEGRNKRQDCSTGPNSCFGTFLDQTCACGEQCCTNDLQGWCCGTSMACDTESTRCIDMPITITANATTTAVVIKGFISFISSSGTTTETVNLTVVYNSTLFDISTNTMTDTLTVGGGANQARSVAVLLATPIAKLSLSPESIKESNSPPVSSSSTASGGLSTGAKAGIGVGAGLGASLIAAVVAFFVLKLRKKQKSETVAGPVKKVADERVHAHEMPNELPERPPVELEEGACLDDSDCVFAGFSQAISESETSCTSAYDQVIVGRIKTWDAEGETNEWLT
ncbi:hypothetical protein BDV96DRAFT_606583 [Lophiotrema nucula]|uniref:Mid2 domain-containing protein n=1 Tax=Lophiotrema nucula TaxID=690887 RepID=A0A6A5YLN2_9PLEO|nr:hypothetical protein BDV96DRAFT_606583 [Lophiotrema nucula]